MSFIKISEEDEDVDVKVSNSRITKVMRYVDKLDDETRDPDSPTYITASEKINAIYDLILHFRD